jgi:type II secretory pathway predicted ATPase ExeA
MEHLNKALHSIAQADTSTRVDYILSIEGVRYPAAERIMNRLEELLTHPKIGRMPNLLLVGETSNGKSVLLKRFCEQHGPYATTGKERIVSPVVSMDVPYKPNEKNFFRKLLDKLNAPYRPSDRVDYMERQVFHILKHIDAKILIIDEIHNLLVNSSNNQRIFLNMLKGIANELQIVIVAAGTMEARNVMSSDPQMSSRFVQKFLPKWSYTEDYLRLLASFEQLLPLRKPSNLTEPTIAERIYAMSEVGTIGEIASVITTAAVAAIHSGKEQIDRKLLDQIDYVSPSVRRRAPN